MSTKSIPGPKRITVAKPDTIRVQGVRRGGMTITLGAPRMDIAQLIRRARIKKGWSKAEAARQIGVTRQTIGDWETGRSAPSRANAPQAAIKLDVPLAAIAGDPGHVNVAILDEGAVTYRRVPLLELIDAGRGAEVTASYVFDDTHEFIETTFPVTERAFALEVHGSSMEPDFQNGDLIIVDPSVLPLADDYIIAEILPKGEDPGPGEVTFKQYRPRGLSTGSPTFDLLPKNPDYPTITVNKNNPGRIIGTVVEHRRSLRK